jgi:hypothetical protein
MCACTANYTIDYSEGYVNVVCGATAETFAIQCNFGLASSAQWTANSSQSVVGRSGEIIEAALDGLPKALRDEFSPHAAERWTSKEISVWTEVSFVESRFARAFFLLYERLLLINSYRLLGSRNSQELLCSLR